MQVDGKVKGGKARSVSNDCRLPEEGICVQFVFLTREPLEAREVEEALEAREAEEALEKALEAREAMEVWEALEAEEWLCGVMRRFVKALACLSRYKCEEALVELRALPEEQRRSSRVYGMMGKAMLEMLNSL